MTTLLIQITGTLFDVPAQFTVQALGGPLSFTFAPQEGISIDKIWGAVQDVLQKTLGFQLPSLEDGPWREIFRVHQGTTITPSLWVTPTGPNGGWSAYLTLDFSQPIGIGGSTNIGPVQISLSPNIQIYAIYLGYDRAAGGLDFRAKISTETQPPASSSTVALPGSSTKGEKFQVVTYPFPIPAQSSTSLFRLKYFGLGQRVGPDPVVTGNDPLASIFAQLEKDLTGNDPAYVIQTLARHFYKPDRDWFIAADLLFRGFELRLLFNDPVMYGLELSAPMVPLTPLSGLLFEILYQKLGPNLGVYYGALTLPYFLRRIPLEGVILILPGFSIWIYTNGDFKVNIGWPVGPNSAGVQISELIGYAGFYFAKLRSSDDPGAQSNVSYDPILEFGIGIMVYAGVQFSAGPFSANLSVTLSATLQGLIAWQSSSSPEEGSALSKVPDHYWFAGTASLVVVLQGSIDFAIIKASVLVNFTAYAGAAFETGYATQIVVSASVSVRVSVKIIFFTIHLSFQTSISHTFTIGSGPPASVNGPQGAGLAIATGTTATPAMLAALDLCDRMLRRHLPRLAKAGILPRAEIPSIDAYYVLQPTAVYDSPASFALIASLFVECAGPTSPIPSPGAATDFELLIVLMVEWLVNQYSQSGNTWSQRFAQVAAALGSGASEPGPPFGGFTGFAQALRQFLQSSLQFNLISTDVGNPPDLANAALLPMPEVLALTYPTPTGTATVDFYTYDPIPANYPLAVDYYFENVGVNSQAPGAMSLSAQATPSNSMAAYVFTDFFLLSARNVIGQLEQAAKNYEAEQNQQLQSALAAAQNPLEAADLVSEHVAALGDTEFDYLLENLDYLSLAGFGSRYLLYGLQLPDPAEIPANPTPQNMEFVPTSGLYVLTGQQFPIVGMTTVTASLTPSPSLAVPPSWIVFPQSSPVEATAVVGLPAALPPMPNPTWHIGSPTGNGGEIDFQPMPPISPNQVVFNLKSRIAWQSPQGPRTIYPMAQPMMSLAASNPGMRIEIQDEAQASPPSGSPPQPANAALLIRTSIQQVTQPVNATLGSPGSPTSASPSSAANTFVPFVYQLGGTDEQTRDLLFQLLQQDLSQATITLLYPDSGSLISDTLRPNVLMAKTNLSTLNQARSVAAVQLRRFAAPALQGNSPNSDWALLTDVRHFLTLLWELSVVNAPGYFLYYETTDGHGLPDELFADSSQPSQSPTGVSKPVPGTAGGTAEFEILVQFSAAPQAVVPVPVFANALTVDLAPPSNPLYAAAFDAAGAPLFSYSSTYPAGDVGFSIQWLLPPVSPEPPVPVDSLYHLLQYSVIGSVNYQQTIWSLPVGPTEGTTASPSGTTPSLYSQTLPVYRFLKGISSPPAENRYLAINKQVTLGFRLIDMYGNALPVVNEAPLLPLYQDPLIGWNEWPGVSASYYFDQGSGAQASLYITAIFDPTAIVAPNMGSPSSPPGSPGSAGTVSRWQSVLARYQLILDQLTDPNTACSLSSTLAGGNPVGNPQSYLVDFARRIALEVQKGTIASPPTPPEEVDTSFSFNFPWAWITSLPDDINPVLVSLTLSRKPALVFPPAITLMPAAVSNTYALPADLMVTNPNSPNVSPNANGSSLTAFGTRFERGFANFDNAGGIVKLTQRSGMDASNDSGQADLWCVRFSDSAGISVKFGVASPGSPGSQPVYFALLPLSTSYWSGQVNQKTVTNIDLDAWARQFLQTVDAFLSPQNAAAIAILDHEHHVPLYDTLLSYKEKLAQTVAQGLTWVFSEQQGRGDVTTAQQLLTQAMLTTLGSAYTVSTLLQAPAVVTVVGNADSPGVTEPPQLFGSVGPTSPGLQSASPSPAGNSNQYSISNATLNLSSGGQWLTSMVTVAQPSQQKSLELPLNYNVSFLQHDFGEGLGPAGYVPSSWLKFVLPGGPALAMGISPLAEIPIPLPFVPEPPSLVLQQTAATPMPSPAGSPEAEIQDALRWDYVVDIAHAWAFQDELEFTVTYNAPLTGDEANFTVDPLDALGQALGNFIESYPALSAQFPLIAQEAYASGEPPSPSAAVPVIQEFSNLVRDVLNAWPQPPSLAANVRVESTVIINHFKLSFSQEGNIYIASLTGVDEDGQSQPLVWPQVSIPNQPVWIPSGTPTHLPDGSWLYTQTFRSLTLAELNQIQFRWSGLTVLQCQTAVLEASVTRNAELVPGFTTQPGFVFSTQTVTFSNPVIPIIKRDALSPLAPGPGLSTTIDMILTPMQALGQGLSPVLRINAFYQYVIANTASGPLYATIPILLADGIVLLPGQSPIDQLSQELGAEIGNWFKGALPSTNGALLNLALTLFGTIEGQQLPLVQLDQIPIAVPPNNLNWWLT